jgi:hypothetical protein
LAWLRRKTSLATKKPVTGGNQGRRHLFSKKLGIYSEKWLKFPFIFKEKRPHNSSTKKESTSHFWEIFFLLQSVAIFDKKK